MNESSGSPFRLAEVAQKRLTAEQLAEVRRPLEERPEDADFNTVEAAIYVGRGTKNLKHAIDAGVDQARMVDHDASGLYATNRHKREGEGDRNGCRWSMIGVAADVVPWIVTSEGEIWTPLGRPKRR